MPTDETGVLTHWIENVLSPVALTSWCLFLLAAAALRAGARRRLTLGLGALAVFYYVITIPLFANLALGALERRARSEQTCPPPPPGSALIVLAGGVDGHPGSPTDYPALKPDSVARLLAAVRIASHTPGSVLVLSGGSGGRNTEADLMAALARAAGFPPDRMLLDRKSTTTDRSAVDTARLLAGRRGPRYLLTSAYHMPRALMAFSASGQQVCAWPVDFQAVPIEPDEMLIPQYTALGKSLRAAHESLGIVFYRLFGLES